MGISQLISPWPQFIILIESVLEIGPDSVPPRNISFRVRSSDLKLKFRNSNL